MRILIAFFIVVSSSPIFSQNFKFGKVSKEELQETKHPLYPESDAAILYRELNTHFDYNQDDGFYLVTEVFERIKIYSNEGFDWGTVELELYEESNRYKEDMTRLKGVTYLLGSDGKIEEVKLKKDGIFEEKLNKYYKSNKFTMPALREGCVIEYEYSIKSPFIGNIDTYRFQETIPINKVSLDFRAPEYLNFKNHRRGWILYNIKENGQERSIDYTYTRSALETGSVIGNNEKHTVKFRENIYNVDLEKVEPLIEEAYAGNLDNYTSSLTFELEYTRFPNSQLEMFATDWEAVTKKVYENDYFGGQLHKDNYFRDDIDKIIAGVTNPNEKIFKIYDFVKNRMNWNKFVGLYADEGVKEAYKQGVGNVAEINLMLVAMLRYAGLKANPVLVSTKSHGIPLFPTRNGFNYVIGVVEVNESVFLLDASNKNGTPTILDEKVLNWQGIIVKEDGTANWVSLRSAEKSQTTYLVNTKISENMKDLTGSVKAQYTGNEAYEKRNTYNGLTESEIIKRIEKENMKISNASFTELENPYQPLKLSFDFSTSDFIEEIDGSFFINPMLFLGMKENPFKLDERKYPMDYGYPQSERAIINIEIPEGYQVAGTPENASMIVGDNIFDFKYLTTQRGNALQLMMNFGINVSSESAENYPAIKEFYQTVVDKEQERIIISKL